MGLQTHHNGMALMLLPNARNILLRNGISAALERGDAMIVS